MQRPTYLRLNRFEAMFLAFGDVMDSMTQAYLLRFDRPLAEAAVRSAFRQLVAAFPRLRTGLEQARGGWRLRVLDDPALIEVLTEDAVRVVPNVDVKDAEGLLRLQTQLLNDPLPLHRGFPFRGVFLPHADTPVIFLCVNHVVGDGRSMLQLATALCGALRGEPVAPLPVENPSSARSIMPPHKRDWPGALWRSWKVMREASTAHRQARLLSLADKQGGRFATTGLRHHDLPCSATAFRQAARALGTSVNTLLNVAVARAALSLAPEDDMVAALRMAVDLRRLFPEASRPVCGNFVTSFVALAPAAHPTRELVSSLDEQARRWLERVDRHDLCLMHLMAELPTWMSRGLCARMVQRVRQRNALPKDTLQTSNIGNADRLLNPAGGEALRVIELRAAAPNVLTFVVIAELQDRLTLTISWRREDVSDEKVALLMTRLDQAIAEVLSTAGLERPGAVAAMHSAPA